MTNCSIKLPIDTLNQQLGRQLIQRNLPIGHGGKKDTTFNRPLGQKTRCSNWPWEERKRQLAIRKKTKTFQLAMGQTVKLH
jgi:hypothetical protein